MDSNTANPQHNTNKGVILLVDDNPNNLKLLTAMLIENGYKVKASNSGRFALQAVHSSPPDLILLDIMMPEMNGYEVCEKLKCDPKSSEIPVIFISALGEASDKIKAFAVGGVDYVSKPFHEAEVLARVHTHLTYRRMQIELEGMVQHRTNQLETKTEELLEEVDERKQVVKTLKTTEQNYREIYNATSESIFIHDAQTGAILEANHAVDEMFGYSVDESLQLNLSDIYAPSTPFSTLNAIVFFQKAVIEGPIVIEWLCLKKNGEAFWAEVALKKSKIGGRGRVIAVIRDISDRKKAEQKLMDSEVKYRQLFENTNEGMVVIQNGIFKICNPAALAIYGYTCQEMTIKRFYDMVHSQDRPKAAQLLEPDIQPKKLTPLQTLRIISKDGLEKYLESKSVSIDWEGTSATLIFFTEITKSYIIEVQKKRLESQLRQAQKMEAIGTLAGGIAHDFNNILAAIFGYIDLAKIHIEKPHQLQKDITQLHNGAIRARDLVKQILTFSRQADKEIQPLQPDIIIKETLKLLRASIPSNIEIRSDIPDAGMILADPTQLHQIVMNLCTNSYHAMVDKGGILAVSLKQVGLNENELKVSSTMLKAGSYLILEVSDTGTGMNKATIDKIFDPYFTTKTKEEGTGLGLSVVHSIVQNYRGHISVYSEPGQGSSFKIYLPSISQAEETSLDEGQSVMAGGDEHILIVDDEKVLVMMMEDMLTSLGYTVTAFTTSDDAVKAFERQPDKFALIITDMVMPKISGLELAQRIQQKKSDAKIILCTGFSDKLQGDNIELPCFKKRLMKPIVMSELAKTVREVLDKK